MIMRLLKALFYDESKLTYSYPEPPEPEGGYVRPIGARKICKENE